jgi:uncharacterized membrane protein
VQAMNSQDLSDGPDGAGTAPQCAICGASAPDLMPLREIRPSLLSRLTTQHPGLDPNASICQRHAVEERSRYVTELLERERGEISALERQVIESIDREQMVAQNTEANWTRSRTTGERLADYIADFGGSWTFILSFFAVLVLWMGFNVWATSRAMFDPYPFILLNLALSCLAAIQAPIIMMSQKRQEAKDRLRAENDYRINLKAEIEIRHLHEKLDHLISRQWERLAEIQQIQLEIMEDLAAVSRK